MYATVGANENMSECVSFVFRIFQVATQTIGLFLKTCTLLSCFSFLRFYFIFLDSIFI